MFSKRERGEGRIPQDILAGVDRARRSGKRPVPSEDPLWYVGRLAATSEERTRLRAELPSLDEVVENAYREAGLEPPERVDVPPRSDT